VKRSDHARGHAHTPCVVAAAHRATTIYYHVTHRHRGRGGGCRCCLKHWPGSDGQPRQQDCSNSDHENSFFRGLVIHLRSLPFSPRLFHTMVGITRSTPIKSSLAST